MKSSFSNLIILSLVLLISHVSRSQVQNPKVKIPVPRELTLIMELQDLPGRATKGSFWEVNYQWRIMDKRDSGLTMNEREKLNQGLLLKRGSFRLDNLLDQSNRQVKITVPVEKELLKRILNHGNQPQILWLNASVRVHDVKLGSDVTKTIDTPWLLGNYPTGVTTVTMLVTAKGEIEWFRPVNFPGQRVEIRKTEKP